MFKGINVDISLGGIIPVHEEVNYLCPLDEYMNRFKIDLDIFRLGYSFNLFGGNLYGNLMVCVLFHWYKNTELYRFTQMEMILNF